MQLWTWNVYVAWTWQEYDQIFLFENKHLKNNVDFCSEDLFLHFQKFSSGGESVVSCFPM